MYSDLFDQLGAGPMSSSRIGNRDHENTSHDPEPLVSFKAGKIRLTTTNTTPTTSAAATTTTTTAAAAAFHCEADPARGEVRMVWKDDGLQWEWYDRRERRVVDTFLLKPDDTDITSSTFQRIELVDKKHRDDRIYVWTRGQGRYEMYWMQDASEEKDDEIVIKVNQLLADPHSAAPDTTTTTGAAAAAAATGGLAGPMVGTSLLGETVTAGATRSSSGSSSSTSRLGRSSTDAVAAAAAAAAANQSQVDALSSILENLGMPQSGMDPSPSASPSTSNTAIAAAASAASSSGMLTLADLQGAMAGIQQQQQEQQQQQQQAGLSLADVVSPGAITSLLESDQVRERLMELLPEEQRSSEYLEENLRSPQVQQTLRSLSAALMPDDNGDMSGFFSVIANFNLDVSDAQAALADGSNPIQAFLTCVLKSVEKEQSDEETKNDQ